MDTDQYSAFPSEKEVLLQDGLEYEILKVFERHEVYFHHDYGKWKQVDVTVIRLRNKKEEYSRKNRCFRAVKLLMN